MTRNPFTATVRWRRLSTLALLLAIPADASAQDAEANKAIARRFYENVWFAPRTDTAKVLVAAEYVVHDIGDVKGVREPASVQQSIADFFWETGTMSGRIDYQIAEGDLVATRWQWEFEPQSLLMKAAMFGGRKSIPIINVFRIQDGKIVEIWNHRHDIDIGFRANVLKAKGFLAGVVFSILVALGWRLWRRRKASKSSQPATA